MLCNRSYRWTSSRDPNSCRKGEEHEQGGISLQYIPADLEKNRNANNKPSTVNMKVMWERDNENESEQQTHPHNRIGFMSAKYPLSCRAHVQRMNGGLVTRSKPAACLHTLWSLEVWKASCELHCLSYWIVCIDRHCRQMAISQRSGVGRC